MNIIENSVKYLSTEKVVIPFEGKVDCMMKEGKVFSKGDILFRTYKRKVSESYFLPKELGVNNDLAGDYICRIEGEYVGKGEILAERLMSGGLMAKRVESQVEGILDFSRLKLGYIDVLAELESEEFIANFSGKIVDINMGKGITLATDVCEIPLFNASSNTKKKYLTNLDSISGSFEVLGDGKSIPSVNNLADSYEGKILFAGRFLYPDLVMELFKRGCKFILIGSMDYNDFVDLNLPVGLLVGFGNIYFDENLFFALKELNDSQVCVDIPSNSIKFLVGINSNLAELFKLNYYREIKKGDIVKSVEVDSFGMIGRVVSIEDEGNYASVLMQNEGAFLINTNNLILYREDFSTMAMGIK